STEFLDSLDADVRATFLRIANEVTLQANLAVKDAEATNRQNILNAGGKINVLNATQREAWVNAMKPVWKQFEKQIGADLISAAAGS
ncbi:MAG: C4-dicarboxylate ABC transporter, partial [Reinekea forsetii]|nr:C4-dicarboxylate ABC transporter [Reinekea forsetii]